MSISSILEKISQHKALKCGHKTQQKGEVHAFGQMTVTKMPVNEKGSFDYCLDCIGTMAIRCAWCGKAIFIGDPITLYDQPADFVMPEYAVTYGDSPKCLVGCLRHDCADTGSDRAGYWLPNQNGEGSVHRVETIYDVIDDLGEGTVVVLDNVSDITEPARVSTFPHSK